MKKYTKVFGIALLITFVTMQLFQSTEAASCQEDITAGAVLGIETVPDSANSDFQV